MVDLVQMNSPLTDAPVPQVTSGWIWKDLMLNLLGPHLGTRPNQICPEIRAFSCSNLTIAWFSNHR